MDWLGILFMVFGIGFATVLSIYLIKKKKAIYVSSLILAGIGFFFIGLGQMPQPAGSWNDLAYTVFGVFSILISIITALVTFFARKYKKKSKP